MDSWEAYQESETVRMGDEPIWPPCACCGHEADHFTKGGLPMCTICGDVCDGCTLDECDPECPV